MPRDGSGVYTQPFPDVVPTTTIESAVYNGFVNDVETDLNTPRPIVAGGTGANNADTALVNLKGEKALQYVTNYDSHVFVSGSFYSTGGATGEPPGGGAQSGVCVVYGDTNFITLTARAVADGNNPGKSYVRQKVSGVWAAWVEQPSGVADLDARYVNITGDSMWAGATLGVPNLNVTGNFNVTVNSNSVVRHVFANPSNGSGAYNIIDMYNDLGICGEIGVLSSNTNAYSGPGSMVFLATGKMGFFPTSGMDINAPLTVNNSVQINAGNLTVSNGVLDVARPAGLALEVRGLESVPSLSIGGTTGYAHFHSANGGYGSLCIGGRPAGPFSAWMQANNTAGVAFPLELNPLGGNVGVGVNGVTGVGPSAKFHVEAGDNDGILLKRAGGALTSIMYNSGADATFAVGTVSNHPVSFYANNGVRMTIAANGDTAIASTTASGGIGTGALTVGGGIGVVKDIWCGGDILAGKSTTASAKLIAFNSVRRWSFSVDAAGNCNITDESGSVVRTSINTSGGWSFGQTVTVGTQLQNGASPTAALRIGYTGGGTMYGITLRPAIDNATAMSFHAVSDAIVGSINTTTSATVYNTSSDGRLKDDLKSFDAGNVVDNTNVYDFKWKTTGERSYGVIAQQAMDVYPAAVTYLEEQDWYGIDYSKYVPVLLQELKALRARVAALEGGATTGAQPAKKK